MGGGGLRILPHKKWHVWRRDNIERVLRDERENEEKQQAINAKERRLAQERRAQQLQVVDGSDLKQHINFFQAEEAQAKGQKGNTFDSKKHKGVDDTLRRHGRLPWYAQSENAAKEQPTAQHERKRKRELDEADPLHHMRPKERVTVKTKERRSRQFNSDDGSDLRKYTSRYDRLSSERRHSKSRKHSKVLCNNKSTANSIGSKESLLQKLRIERIEREATERRKADRIMQ
ncbi:uncharacterized protein PHALS_00574 [Plasmopara halstedii]|uniref:CBF1-interacting co-repressor CIR N-terminal domain-containing protein n=1 Tax=Plasmopara halstedii TaxID=4781 RepID=A0A0P1ARQ2_PLAHL|nr:uncharacterized protein PHALS_00574 [Plasmopara halstedii]CEG44287.1 hypothetical protein PHALS_00574 [Plasmopara halstedii]|eukprot:XP_024580656.1 hypothetical protein PHALS_00574 [Plasmopara halstedii]